MYNSQLQLSGITRSSFPRKQLVTSVEDPRSRAPILTEEEEVFGELLSVQIYEVWGGQGSNPDGLTTFFPIISDIFVNFRTLFIKYL